MSLINYSKFTASNPFPLGTGVNQKGQLITFYEDPINGDEGCIIAVCHKEKKAFKTSFYDTGDFYRGSDYNVIFKESEAYYAYELEY